MSWLEWRPREVGCVEGDRPSYLCAPSRPTPPLVTVESKGHACILKRFYVCLPQAHSQHRQKLPAELSNEHARFKADLWRGNPIYHIETLRNSPEASAIKLDGVRFGMTSKEIRERTGSESWNRGYALSPRASPAPQVPLRFAVRLHHADTTQATHRRRSECLNVLRNPLNLFKTHGRGRRPRPLPKSDERVSWMFPEKWRIEEGWIPCKMIVCDDQGTVHN